MNTTTADTTRVPSPTDKIATEAPAANLPAEVVASHREQERRQAEHPNVPAAFLTPGPFGEVIGAVAAVMKELKPVGKGGKNTFHDYKYARMQDILQELTPLMGEHGIVVFQYERQRQSFDDGKVIAVQYDFVVAHKSGQTWVNPVPQTGMSPCRTSNGKFDDKAYAKCHTSARKYFLLSLFQIPTEDEDDPDNQKRNRAAAAPVPGPTGYTPPHRIEPARGETPETWSAKYEAAISHSKDANELARWDNENDGLLAELSDKTPDLYARVMATVAKVQAGFAVASAAADNAKAATPAPTGQTARPDPISTGKPDPGKAGAAMAAATDNPAFERPEGCPDAEKEPDKFLSWAAARLAQVETAGELEVYWREVIDPASDGLTPPDFEELQGLYAKAEKRLGGD
jgi:ERF superfamily